VKTQLIDADMPDFIPGIDLARNFYHEVVRDFVKPPHAACLLGEGSEVLGYDQPRSTDHAWGPRLQIFVAQQEIGAVANAVEQGLPPEFRGWPVRFFKLEVGKVTHHVEVATLDDWLARQLGLDPRAGLTTASWLALPQQRLLHVTAGAVFRDDTGELTAVRNLLQWYPSDVWLWMMSAQWHLIGNAEPLIGRTAEASDPRGSALVASSLIRLMMQLCFLQERRYWPYAKWFGTAFSRLDAAPTLGPLFDAVIAAHEHSGREEAIIRALRRMAERHNDLHVTPAVEPSIGHFEVNINNAVRPYRVLNAGRFAAACRGAIKDASLRALTAVGAVDQLTHADDAMINFTNWPMELGHIYQKLLSE
jgi:hypothetical protein